MVQRRIKEFGGPIAPGMSIGGPGNGRQDSISLGGKAAKIYAIQINNSPALEEGQEVSVEIRGRDGKMHANAVVVPANPDPEKVRDLLIAAINTNREISDRVEAYHNRISGELLVEGRVPGDDFDLNITATVFNNYNSFIRTMPSDGPVYHFGTVICLTLDGEGGEPLTDGNQSRIAGILLQTLKETLPGEKVASYKAGEVAARQTEGPVTVRITPGVKPRIGQPVYARYRINQSGPSGQVVHELTTENEGGFTLDVSNIFAWDRGPSGEWRHGIHVAPVMIQKRCI